MAQKHRRTVYADGSIILSNFRNKRTNETYSLVKTALYCDGTPMTAAKCDGEIYRNSGSEYFIKAMDLSESRTLTVNNLLELRSLSKKNLILLRLGYYNKVETRGYYTAGDGGGSEYLVRVDLPGVDDSFLIIKPTNGLGIQFNPSIIKGFVNVKVAGAKCDNITNDLIPVQKAASSGFSVFFPAGRCVIDEGLVKLTAGVKYFGESKTKSIIVRKADSIPGMGGLGMLYLESPSENEYEYGTSFKDLGFDGLVETLGSTPSIHLIGLAGTENTVFEDCDFLGFRTDAIYIGGGRSGSAIYRRHNRDVKLIRCDIDGLINSQRNGVSIIDCDGLIMDGTTVARVGNPFLSVSVGGVDFERNSYNLMYARDIRIINCKFVDIYSVNTSAITIFNTFESVSGLADHVFIGFNEFVNCYWGVSIAHDTDNISPFSESARIILANNYFKYCVNAVRGSGRGVEITGNDFKGDETRFCHIKLAPTVYPGNLSSHVVDYKIKGNRFDFCGQTGVIEITGGRNVEIDDNTVTESKPFIYLLPDNLCAPRRALDHLKITNNHVKSHSRNVEVGPGFGNTYFFNVPAGFNTTNFLINGSCEESGNTLDGRVVRISGSFTVNKSVTTAPPASGTWSAGNELLSSQIDYSPNNGRFKVVCTKSGTFGTDDKVHTVSVVNGSNRIPYTDALKTKLRAGHYVSIDGSVLTFKIVEITDSFLFTDIAYNGVTGEGKLMAWTAPEFASIPIQIKYTKVSTNGTLAPGSMHEVYELNTGSSTLTVPADSTTVYGTVKEFKNNGTSAPTLSPGTGVTFDGGTAAINLPNKGDYIKLFALSANTWSVVIKNTAGTGAINGQLAVERGLGDVNAIGSSAAATFLNKASNQKFVGIHVGKALQNGGAGTFGCYVDITNPINAYSYMVNHGDDELTKSLIIKRGGLVGIGTTNPTEKLHVDGAVKTTQLKLSQLNVAPASSTAAGEANEIRFTTTGVYVCIATNTWIRMVGQGGAW